MAIIVGDIHGDIEKAQAFLAYKPEALHVALGDYLDSYHESIERQVKCLQLLVDSEAVLLLGNHECHYLRNPLFEFAGYQNDHADILQDLMEANLYRFKAAYEADGWLLTHAGANNNITGTENDEQSLAVLYNSQWLHYTDSRFDCGGCKYLYESIFHFNHCIHVEGNLLPENVKQIFGHMEHARPIVESNYIALDTTNYCNSCWIFDTETCELVQLPLEPKIGRVRFQRERGCNGNHRRRHTRQR